MVAVPTQDIAGVQPYTSFYINTDMPLFCRLSPSCFHPYCTFPAEGSKPLHLAYFSSTFYYHLSSNCEAILAEYHPKKPWTIPIWEEFSHLSHQT